MYILFNLLNDYFEPKTRQIVSFVFQIYAAEIVYLTTYVLIYDQEDNEIEFAFIDFELFILVCTIIVIALMHAIGESIVMISGMWIYLVLQLCFNLIMFISSLAVKYEELYLFVFVMIVLNAFITMISFNCVI